MRESTGWGNTKATNDGVVVTCSKYGCNILCMAIPRELRSERNKKMREEKKKREEPHSRI